MLEGGYNQKFSMVPIDERKKLSAGMFNVDPNEVVAEANPALLSPGASAAAGAGVSALTAGANPEGNVALGGGVLKGALAGSQFGIEGAAVGAGAGLVTGMLGAAAAKKERQRQAMASHYNRISAIEGDKQTRIANAMQNMSQGIGQTLLSNQKVSL